MERRKTSYRIPSRQRSRYNEEGHHLSDELSIDSVVVGDRVRKDFGNIDELANSIREVGLIQPIVLTRDLRLVAGERRLRALHKIGVTTLLHGKLFIYNDEQDELKLQAMEIEENVKRQNFTWQEQIIAKKRLLEVLQKIHGVARPGYPSRSDTLGITSAGFGINKLASLLGESNAQTSKDIELAALIEQVPQLRAAETKEAARRQVALATSVITAQLQQAKNPPKTEQKWSLYEGDFIVNSVNSCEANSMDMVIVDPPYGADTSGMGPNSKVLLAKPFKDSLAPTNIILSHLAEQSYRVLRANTFACFFFDFVLYRDLIEQLVDKGFDVDIVPLIWIKNTVINTSPYTRYGRSYEPILIARKGEPKLMRPSQRDVISVQNVITTGLQEKKYYQAQKPVELIEKLILDMCVPGGTVVDFCAGSGTTGVAALKNGRRAVLFEKDSMACDIIKARLGAL
jgi:DNA modification methylase/ParB-like chromosome segregation protein Spo0J